VREHLAGRIVDHDRGAVAHVVLPERAELPCEHVGRQLLEGCGQGRAHALSRRRQQAVSDMRSQRRHDNSRRPLTQGERGVLHVRARDTCQPLRRERAGPFGDPRRGRVRRRNQACEHERFGCIEPRWRLAEQHLRRGIDALELAAEGHAVEIDLQDLLLAPAALDQPGIAHLPEFLRDRTTACSGVVGHHQSGDLHRDRAATTPSRPVSDCQAAARIARQSMP
jgi:hypothetical protein